MKAFMWFMILAAACLAFVIGCYPVPATATATSQAEIQAFSPRMALERQCDKDTSVCCYHVYAQGLSCVVIPNPGKIWSGKYNGYKTPQVERGTRVLGQSILLGPWEGQ